MRLSKNELYKGYDSEFLLSELRRFYGEHGRIPKQKELDDSCDYPSRKTYSKYFGTLNKALRAAGFEIKIKSDYSDKEYLLSEIKRFMVEFERQPFAKDMDNTKGYPCKSVYTKAFGSWNNALKELGLNVRVSNYSNEELDDAFHKFVDLNGRPPTHTEFNNDSKYPSFWCYQNRFGSWNNAVIHYGFTPNEGVSGIRYTFDNGEVCKSNYEFDVSNWLRKNNISYLRNIPYKDFIDTYERRKDCDYVIIYKGEFIWLEIAGLYTNKDKKSSMERDYIKRFDHKVENLLKNFYHKVFYPDDFKNNSIDELFFFLSEIPDCKPWFIGEPIYRGMPNEFDEVV